MPNFANGKIYAIRSPQTQQIYIGSTTQPLYKRFHRHKTMYCSSKEIMKYPDCYIELLENYACSDKNELNRREGELIRLHDCVNKQIAGRTPVEYKVDNRQEILSKNKQYYQENKTEKIEQSKQYYRDNKQTINEQKNQKYNCFCGGRYTNANKNRHFKSNNHLEIIRQLSETTSA